MVVIYGGMGIINTGIDVPAPIWYAISCNIYYPYLIPSLWDMLLYDFFECTNGNE